ncbi:MAG: TatD family hydrolase [Candidatus Limnocylindria bacterium]
MGAARAGPPRARRAGALPPTGAGEDPLIDAHAHLTDARFAPDLEAVLGRARDAGVSRILTCGEDVGSSIAALAVAMAHPEVRVAVGVHPHRAASLDDAALADLRRLAMDERVVAIGEIGIDFSGRSAARPTQERAFLRQLDLASELGLPVVVHVRDAGAQVRALLAGRTVRGQLHCYSEGPDELGAWRAIGLVPSFAGPVTYRASRALRQAARGAAALLVETDAPYLAPEGHRGQRNEPAFVAITYAAIAAERGSDVPSLVATTERVARELFGSRWEPPGEPPGP